MTRTEQRYGGYPRPERQSTEHKSNLNIARFIVFIQFKRQIESESSDEAERK